MTEKQFNELKARLVELFEPVARMVSDVTAELVKRVAEAEKVQKEMPEVPVEAMKEIQTFCRGIVCVNCPMYDETEIECGFRNHAPFCWEIPTEEDE